MIKILVIDDEAGVCQSIKQAFSYVGFTVLTATTAKKALSLFKKEKPKVVFLDILMPDMDGVELLRQIKAEDAGAIVIMVTAKDDEETRRQALENGADEYITKPFSFDELRVVALKKIQNLLGDKGHMQKPRILIVDDEEQARANFREFIALRYTCDIDEAADGQAAIVKVKATLPDLILMDIRMPGISGIEVIDEIKQISPTSRVLVISAWKSPDVVNKAIAKGAFDYLSKPVDLSLFKERLEAILTSMGKLIKKEVQKKEVHIPKP